MALAVDLKKCKSYVFDQMPNYIEQKLVDEAVAIYARCITSLAISIGIPVQRKSFKYDPWLVIKLNTTLQKSGSLDCRIFCAKFVECLVTNADHDCLNMDNMKLFRQQYVVEFWANKFYW